MNQQEVIARFIEADRMKMNDELFERSDEKIMQQLMDAIRSCERKGTYFSIEVKGFTVVDDYAEINNILYNYYERAYRNKTKAKKKDNRYDYINLNESDIRLLIIHYKIADKETSQNLDVIVAVPRIIDKYYIRIDGIMRSTLFQVVDGSTYNNSTSMSKAPSVTMKLVFMAVRIFRKYVDLPLEDGDIIKAVYYTAFSFNKTVGAFKYILAKFGLNQTMEMYGLNYIMIRDQPIPDSRWYNFKKADNLYVCVPRVIFDQDLVTQSLVSTIFLYIYPQIPIYEFYSMTYWVRSIGADFNRVSEDKFVEIFTSEDKSMVPDTLDKGYNILDSFETIYDRCTYNALKLDENTKENMYNILMWMLREFNNLRMKDNLDISIKRVRFDEYVASLYIMKIAKGIYRVADMNKRVTVESIIRAIKTDPLYLLKSIVMSKMISYRNMVTDMDSLQALKFTYKGVSGLGEGSNKSIPDIYRSIHPSHLGRVDLDASSDGNPGITGTLNPFMEMHDGYFSDYQEPMTWEDSYAQTVSEFQKVNKLIDAIVFQDNLLGTDNSKEVEVLGEISQAMQQIINPIVFKMDQGIL